MQAKDFNRPDSGCSITNSRGLRLHFRVDWDNFTAAKMVLFYVHGFGGHCNRVEARTMARTFNSGGAAVVLMDQMGHGYSEGERALLLSHEDLVEDLVQLIAALMAPGTVEAGREATLSTEVSGSPNLGKLSTLPFFVMGGSMGGAVSLLTAHALRTDERYRDLGVPVCRGAVLMAPALSFKLPHWAVVETMRYTFGTCNPSGFMPAFLNKLGDNSLTFLHQETMDRNVQDAYGVYENALAWTGLMRWGSALMFINMAPKIDVLMAQVTVPFLLLHDPADEICCIEGSRKLFITAATPAEQKEIMEVTIFILPALLSLPTLRYSLSAIC